MGWHLSELQEPEFELSRVYFSGFLKCSLSQRGIRVSEFELTE